MEHRVASSLTLLAEGEDAQIWGVIVYDAEHDPEPLIYIIRAYATEAAYAEAERLYRQLQEGADDGTK